jgi:hypothetical protein
MVLSPLWIHHLIEALSILRTMARFVFLVLFAAGSAGAMDFRVAGNELHLSGRVLGDEVGLLKDVEAAYPAIDTVVFRNSPGGDAWTGHRIGERIRDKGWRTVVVGGCISACTLMFLGGASRHFAQASLPERMYLAFHGTSSSAFLDHGAPAPRGRVAVRRWIDARTGGRVEAALMDRFVNNEKRLTVLRAYDPGQLKREDGVSVLFCDGAIPQGRSPFDHCEKLPGRDALSLGFITSAERIAVTPPPT